MLHVFVLDPFWFKPLPLTGFPKIGPVRSKFLQQCLEDMPSFGKCPKLVTVPWKTVSGGGGVIARDGGAAANAAYGPGTP